MYSHDDYDGLASNYANKIEITSNVSSIRQSAQKGQLRMPLMSESLTMLGCVVLTQKLKLDATLLISVHKYPIILFLYMGLIRYEVHRVSYHQYTVFAYWHRTHFRIQIESKPWIERRSRPTLQVTNAC